MSEIQEKPKTVQQREAFLKVKAISDPNSEWILTQELLQEVEANFICADPAIKHETPKLVNSLKSLIEQRYANEEEVKQLLLESIPSDRSVTTWRKKEGWEEAVWKHIKNTGLFTPAKRAEMIEALFQRGVTKSDNAAKMYLTMSGDYSEKLEVNDKAIDTFREINTILHRKKKEE